MARLKATSKNRIKDNNTFVKKSLSYLKASFRIDKQFLLAGFYDIIFYGIVFAVYAYIMLKILTPNWNLINEANKLTMLAAQDMDRFDMQRTKVVFDGLIAMRNQLFLSFGMVAVLFFFMKSLVWSKLAKKKFTVRYLLGFTAINILIMVLLVLSWLFFGLILKPEVLILFILVFLLPLFFHVSTIMNSLLASHGMKKSFSELKRTAVSNIHYFFPAHIIMLIVLAVMTIIDFVILDNMFMFPVMIRRALLVLILVMFVFFMTWIKSYVLRITEGVQDE